METNGENVILGNPTNRRRDAVEQNDAKVTHADHPRQADRDADDLFDDSISKPVAPPPAPAVKRQVFDMHAATVRDPDTEMVGEATSHRDPLSGESGTHPVAVGVGAAAGGAAVGAATGLVAGAVAGPLGAAFGTAAGAVIGAIAGGYAGKGIGEAMNPTTEDHYWRGAFRSRPYVEKGAQYEEYEPAYGYGIQMREWLIDQTWEEAEPVIRTGWEESEYGVVMGWERAHPAVQDAWDRLTPEPGEEGVTEEEKGEAD